MIGQCKPAGTHGFAQSIAQNPLGLTRQEKRRFRLRERGLRPFARLSQMQSVWTSTAARPPVFNSVGAGHLGGIGIDDERLAFAVDRILIDHHLLDILKGR